MASNPSSRNFKFLLYEEDLSHIHSLSLLMEYDSFVYIVHDKDIDEFGEVKKPHIHGILMLPSHKCLEQLCSEIKLPSNYCQVINGSRVSPLRYLIHIDHPDKFQYPVSDVIGTSDGLLKFQSAIQAKDKIDESECAGWIIEYIENSVFPLTVSNLAKWSVEKGCFAVFRRGFSLYCSILHEHNDFLKRNKTYRRKD